jgi:hypothetical protein
MSMIVQVPAARMWILSSDRETVRMQLPPVPVLGVPKPLEVKLDFDAEMVDEIISRLIQLRSQMLPAPTRN